MARSPDTLPEGTNAIIDDNVDFEPAPALQTGSGGTPDFEPSPALGGSGGSFGDMPSSGNAGMGGSGTGTGSIRSQIDGKAADLRGQATDKARHYALLGKDAATGKLDEVVGLINDAAVQIDSKVGGSYGDYARRAADAVAGLSSTLQQKDVDELFDDARDAVRKSPAIAIGAAAALGFVVARLVKAGTPAATGGTAGSDGPETGFEPTSAAYTPSPTPTQA